MLDILRCYRYSRGDFRFLRRRAAYKLCAFLDGSFFRCKASQLDSNLSDMMPCVSRDRHDVPEGIDHIEASTCADSVVASPRGAKVVRGRHYACWFSLIDP